MSANKNDGKSLVRFRAFGCVSLMGTHIHGNLECRGALLREILGGKSCPLKGLRVSEDKEWSFSLNARDVFVGGDVLFQASRFAPLLFRATSRICLSGARIGGALSCRGALLSKEFDLNNADIETNVYLGKKSDIGKRQYVFRSNEAVTLRNTRIKGRFECANATLKHQPTRQNPPDAGSSQENNAAAKSWLAHLGTARQWIALRLQRLWKKKKEDSASCPLGAGRQRIEGRRQSGFFT